MRRKSISELQDKIGYRFRNAELLEEATTTRSYSDSESSIFHNYQRLEFLGDRVISLILADELFELGALDEGKMTLLKSALENNKKLAECGEKIGLRSYIRATERRVSKKVVADVFEAICGAIYLDTKTDSGDSGKAIWEVKSFLLRSGILWWMDRLLEARDILPIRNRFENKFREINRQNPQIEFEYTSSGEDHEKRWKVERCLIKDARKERYIELEGVKRSRWFNSKKDAETDAIKRAYNYMKKRGWKL